MTPSVAQVRKSSVCSGVQTRGGNWSSLRTIRQPISRLTM